MNKKEAAAFLAVSERALERYAQQGRLSVRYEKGKTKPTPVYDEGELKALKAELERAQFSPRPKVISAPAPDSDDPATALSPVSEFPNLPATVRGDGQNQALMLLRALEALGAAQQPGRPVGRATVAVEHKLLLTLAEAQALTGLSRAVLREAVEAGTLKAKQIGRSWRVKRGDLESYVETL